ncbi:hypothetical protein B484DRAFT_391582 [Ochromonadaceae sp. CCMP2298]|nr:hypothetical protein B484DRAFT_391582 [Ochromonadaceae sp. CCMP2298]
MALRVEVAGYGLCQTATPYSVFVVCVQQEKFEAWTVYRRYNSFQLLREQLLSLHPTLPPIPPFDAEDLRLENLENCRVVLDRWLQSVASNSYILRMQSMYQFLCIDANMPPPYLEIHWRDSTNGSFEEMEMDDMFDGEMNDGEDEEDDEDDEDEDEEWEDEDDGRPPGAMAMNGDMDTPNVFGIGKKSAGAAGAKRPARPSATRSHKQAAGSHRSAGIADENDGMDIQSLSVVEAEFIFNKLDEGKEESETVEVKRTINLDAFKIIRVIGKGERRGQNP